MLRGAGAPQQPTLLAAWKARARAARMPAQEAAVAAAAGWMAGVVVWTAGATVVRVRVA
jgi:hypothetical protein